MAFVEGYRLHRWREEPVWQGFEVPDPGPGEVRIAVEACGIGLTVLNCMNGDLGDSPDLLPFTPGHEVVGRIESVGEGVASPKVGDRVMTYFYLSCFACRECLSGREPRCERPGGFYGVHMDGGYAPISLLPAGNAVPLAQDTPAAQATVVPDAVATSVHVCRTRLQLGPEHAVAVIGAGGGVGIHMVQVARACGATVAALERTDEKLALIERHGAIPVDSNGFRAELKEMDGAADAVIDLVGTRDSLAWGLSHLRSGGRLCVLTTFRDVGFHVTPRDLVFKERSIVGNRYASRAELIEATSMVASGLVEPVIGAVVGSPDVREVHEMLRAGRLEGRGALVWEGSS